METGCQILPGVGKSVIIDSRFSAFVDMMARYINYSLLGNFLENTKILRFTAPMALHFFPKMVSIGLFGLDFIPRGIRMNFSTSRITDVL